MNFKGQEKIQILKGEFKGCIGYVRGLRANNHLWIILDNGYKISIHQDDVVILHHNYFLENMERVMKSHK